MDTFFASRPCNPRIQSIRQATVDLLSEGSGLTPVNISISRPFLATRLQARSSESCNALTLHVHYAKRRLYKSEHINDPREVNCPLWSSVRLVCSIMPSAKVIDPCFAGDSRQIRCNTLPVLVQGAGLDLGWGQQIDMDYNSDLHRYEVIRHLPPGRYAYKFIMDGRWTYSADHPTFTVSCTTQSGCVGMLCCLLQCTAR